MWLVWGCYFLEQSFAERPEPLPLGCIAGRGCHGLLFGPAAQASEAIWAVMLAALGAEGCGGMELVKGAHCCALEQRVHQPVGESLDPGAVGSDGGRLQIGAC